MKPKEKFNTYFKSLRKGTKTTIGEIHTEIRMSRHAIIKYILEEAVEGRAEINRDDYDQIIGVKKL